MVARAERPARITADDVLAYLGPRALLDRDDPALREAVERQAGQVARLIVEERLARRHRGFGRYFETMPRILFLHGRGYTADEIAAEMPFLCSGFGVETVLRLVAEAVARRVARAA